MTKSFDSPLTSLPIAPRLSKSKFLSGLQCHKRLYLEVHHPTLATKPDGATQAMFEMGTGIGVLARERFPGGVLVTASYRQTAAALAHTARLIHDVRVPAIFEAAFLSNGVLIRADILERVLSMEGSSEGWRLIEVKSSTKVKDVHLEDLAIQSEVLLGAGLTLVSMGLMYINTAYRYQEGPLDLSELFAIEDLSEAVRARRLLVSDRLMAMTQMLGYREAPAIEPDQHCKVPYDCPFWAHCTQGQPPRWIQYLPGSKQVVRQLRAQGITTIDEIPADTKLSVVQRRVQANVEWISPRLAPALQTVQFPVHHLDFETVMLGVPRFSGMHPYQALPVQWSNHIEQSTGTLTHEEFLHTEMSDPRQRFAESVVASLGLRGSICVYSPYEQSILQQLAVDLPTLKPALLKIIARLWDLHSMIETHYYHPAFNGSYSIKVVLPALVPALAYDDLVIQDGGYAASLYYQMVFVETDWVEQAATAEALLRYCERDTLAMVELRRALWRRVHEQGI